MVAHAEVWAQHRPFMAAPRSTFMCVAATLATTARRDGRVAAAQFPALRGAGAQMCRRADGRAARRAGVWPARIWISKLLTGPVAHAARHGRFRRIRAHPGAPSGPSAVPAAWSGRGNVPSKGENLWRMSPRRCRFRYNTGMIYLDNNATTRVAPAVLEAMLPYLRDSYGNPSSMHRFGQEARQAVEHARHQVAALLGCMPREIVFTSGGTEADNAAIFGALAAAPKKRNVITSSVEHSAVREPMAVLRRQGYHVEEIPVDRSGALNLRALKEALAGGEVALVSVMWANNETGVIFNIPEIAAIAHAAGAMMHVDAVQAAGKFPINFSAAPVDFLSASAHKIHGPKGAGALAVRRGARWLPCQHGGPQERQRRGGTENVAAIVGFGAAAELAREELKNQQAGASIARLRDALEQGILARVADAHVNGAAPRLGNTTNIGFAHLEAEAILLLLSEADICASAGAACASGSLEPSHVLQAMGVPDAVAHGAIRFSLSNQTTEEEIAQTLETLPAIIERLRKVLPVG